MAVDAAVGTVMGAIMGATMGSFGVCAWAWPSCDGAGHRMCLSQKGRASNDSSPVRWCTQFE
jgi:hypothetical protein